MVVRTVTNVAGKKVKVTTAMVFMAAPSSLVASAICKLKVLFAWDNVLESLYRDSHQ
jgi:hypothetical protein